MNADDRVLVMEVGGTSTRAARFHEGTSTITGLRTASTPELPADSSTTQERLRSSLRTAERLSAQVMDGGSPDRVGLAFAGPIDAAGRVLAAPTITRAGAQPVFDLRGASESMWPTAQIVVTNDLTAAGLALVDRGHRDFAVMTIGSGIGHKVFIDGVPRVAMSLATASIPERISVRSETLGLWCSTTPRWPARSGR